MRRVHGWRRGTGSGCVLLERGALDRGWRDGDAQGEEVWQRPKKVEHEKARFTQRYGGPLKISAGCVEECCVKVRWRGRGSVDAEAVRGDG